MSTESNIVEQMQAVRALRRRNIGRAECLCLVHTCVEDIVLTHGSLRHKHPLRITPAEFGERRLGYCYSNALALALSYPERFTYCEGFATVMDIAINHAWCLDEDGFVIDPTWQDDTPMSDSAEYFGIAFVLDFVLDEVRATKEGGLLALGTPTARKRIHLWCKQGLPLDALEIKFKPYHETLSSPVTCSVA